MRAPVVSLRVGKTLAMYTVMYFPVVAMTNHLLCN